MRLATAEIELVTLLGGGHVAQMRLAGLDVNPLWEPPWPTFEPETLASDEAPYGAGEGRLLASLAGHSLCLDHFGELSLPEVRAGGHFHGEAPNLPWKVFERGAGQNEAWLGYGLDLPEAGLRFSRTIRLREGERVLRFEEQLENPLSHDMPLGYQQHISFGPPFVEPGATRLDLPGGRGRTFPRPAGPADALSPDRDFQWPCAPAAGGGDVDVRLDVFPARQPCASLCGVLLEGQDPSPDGFVAVSNRRLGLLVMYQWSRETFPWVALWVESKASEANPWLGRTTVWGVEFGSTPLPLTRIETFAAGPLFGRRRFAVLPAKSTLRVSYQAVLERIPADWGGVRELIR